MIIEDGENPTGMFSKAGRLSIEMFSLLQEKDNILQNKKKVYNPQTNDHNKPKSSNVQFEQHRKTEQLKLKGYTATAKSDQPFTKVVSRSKLDDADDKLRINNQKFGMYNPKYHFIFEKSPFYQDENFLGEQKEKFQNSHLNNSILGKWRKGGDTNKSIVVPTKNESAKTLAKPSDNLLHSIIQEKDSVQHWKGKGVLSFDQQSQRKPFIEGPGPHEKRFLFLELPKIYSNVVKSPCINLANGKKGSDIFVIPQSGLQYDLNMDSIYPKSPKMVPNFAKVVARKFPQKPIYTMDESYADTSMYRDADIKLTQHNNSQVLHNDSQILKRIPGMNFDNMIPRERQKHVINAQRIEID